MRIVINLPTLYKVNMTIIRKVCDTYVTAVIKSSYFANKQPRVGMS